MKWGRTLIVDALRVTRFTSCVHSALVIALQYGRQFLVLHIRRMTLCARVSLHRWTACSYRRHGGEGPQDLMRMIGIKPCPPARSLSLFFQGYLTAISCEDRAVLIEVCDRASATKANAKEATKALRREFKCVSISSPIHIFSIRSKLRYGEAFQQLSATQVRIPPPVIFTLL